MREKADEKENSIYKKDGPLKRAAKILEIPQVIIENAVHIELSGNREMIMEGCMGIIEYDEDFIKISAGRYAVKITGRDIMIKNLTRDSAVISGFFLQLEYIF